jgi:hypothetical protein
MLGPSVLYAGWSTTANLGEPTASSGNRSLVTGRMEGRTGTLPGAQLLLPPGDCAIALPEPCGGSFCPERQ